MWKRGIIGLICCVFLFSGIVTTDVYAFNWKTREEREAEKESEDRKTSREQDRAVTNRSRAKNTNDSKKNQVRKQIEDNNKLMSMWKALDDFVKGRDYLVYAYANGMISYEEFEENMNILISNAELHGYTIQEYQEKIRQENSFRTNEEIVSDNAKLVMYEMWNGISDTYKNMTLEEIDEPDSRYGGIGKDKWYLCPYGCRVKNGGNWYKVDGWGAACKEPGKSHTVLTDENSSFMRVTTTEVLQDNQRVNYTTFRTRRDCSAYVSCVLYNLGFDYMWKNDTRIENIGTGTLTGLIDTFKKSELFDVLPYSKDSVSPGDIVLKVGHVEIFMGWKNKDTNEVYHYSWGSSKDVYMLKDNGPNGVWFNTFKAAKQDNSYGLGRKPYTYIIRYKGQDRTALAEVRKDL